MKIISTISLYILILHSISCSKETIKVKKHETIQTNVQVVENDSVKIEFLNKKLISDSYTLINNAQTNRAYIIDKNGTLIHNWPLQGKRLGNDAYLMSNGQLLTMLEAEKPQIKIGGFGGKLQIINTDGSIAYNFDYSTNTYILHHDAEMLPNGNIIAQIWERKTAEQAKQAGSELNVDLFTEAIIEINPTSNTIVWEWHAWDHLIQEYNSTKDNYGVIANNPNKINLNYTLKENGDIMHANGITYDIDNDAIILSVNYYSEIWVIDHSTTVKQAKESQGGNYNKGGDLIYRFGNPSTYNNIGERILFHNHFPNLLTGEEKGNLLVLSNGQEQNQSTVYELQLPEIYNINIDYNNEPKIVWRYTHPDLYSGKVSGATRLPNGNTLITEGDFGLWEVTKAKEVVWKYSASGFFWRAYHYNKDSEAIINLNLK